MKKSFIIILLTFLLFLASCGNYPDNYIIDYETVDAVVIDIEMRYWFAVIPRYEWNIEVYYEPYNIYYDENSYSSGVLGAPSFLYSQKGDMIKAQIINVYSDTGELIEQEIINIY